MLITVRTRSAWTEGKWELIGRFPYSDGGTAWQIPGTVPCSWSVRIEHEETGVSAESTFETAILRLENFPPNPIIGRGSLLEIGYAKAYSGDSPNTPPTYLLSTDGGQSWPFSGGLEKQFVTFPASDDCLLRLTHPDIPFEDTSATFTVVDDLETIPYLRVGQEYVYQTILVEWQRQAGGQE